MDGCGVAAPHRLPAPEPQQQLGQSEGRGPLRLGEGDWQAIARYTRAGRDAEPQSPGIPDRIAGCVPPRIFPNGLEEGYAWKAERAQRCCRLSRSTWRLKRAR